MRADRLLSLLLLLQNRGKIKARELAERLEVSRRTIYRDLDALSRAGVPVYAEPGPAGGVSLSEGYRSRWTSLSVDEAQALASLQAPGSPADLGLSRSLKTALIKLAADLPSVQQLAAERSMERLYFDTRPWFHEAEELPQLPIVREAVWNDRRLGFEYQKTDGSRREETCEPYALVCKVDHWYLVAGTERGRRVFRVSRVRRAEILEEGFERPELDLEEVWRSWCRRFEQNLPAFHVRLRVAPSVEGTLGQRVPLWRLVEERSTAEGWREIVVDFQRRDLAFAEILALGGEVRVEEPEELRLAIEATARAILATAERRRP